MATGAELKGHVRLGCGVRDRSMGDCKLRGLVHSSGGVGVLVSVGYGGLAYNSGRT